MISRRRAVRPEWLVASAFLGSGAALLVYILSGVSLRWTFLSIAACASVVLVVAMRRLAPDRRRRLRRRVGIGAACGLAGTIVYDGVRLALVEVGGLDLNPLEAWRLFGIALTDPQQPAAVVMAAGTGFHLINGVAFGVAYTVAFGERGPLAGIAWAFVLETFMVSVYPGWLGLKALGEFLSVSISAHVAYGAVLGWLARALLRSSRWGEHVEQQSQPAPGTHTRAAAQ